MRFFLIISLVFSFSCAENENEGPTTQPSLQTTKHAVVDPGGDNWIAVGGDGFIDLLGKDGEPDVISGRVVFDGADVLRTISGHDKWVVFGGGKLQSLDNAGQRINDVRDALSGSRVNTAAVYPMGWLIGGENGRLQTLDTSGEPTVAETTIFGGDTVAGVAYSGVAWLALSATGKTLTFNADLNIADSTGTQVLTEGIGSLSNADINVGPRWLIFSKNEYATVTASGVAGASNSLPASDIGSVHLGENSVFIGGDNGDIYRADYGSVLTFSKVATMKSAIRHFVSDTQGKTLALAQGSILSLNTSDGSQALPEQDIQENFVSAHYSVPADEWVIVYEKSGLVRFFKSDLTPKQGLSPRLNGEQINGAAKGTEGVLIVGNAGMIQLVEDNGSPISTPTNIGNLDLLDVEWNGENFFVVGKGGFSQIVSASGVPGANVQLLDGEDIRFASWSGSFFLIGGQSNFQVVRPTGVALGAAWVVDALLLSAAFDGERWMAVGEWFDGSGVAMFIDEEGTNDIVPILVPSIPVLKGVDFDGLEWLVGGTDGLIQRVSASGQKIGGPVSVLDGLDINTVFFNGIQYLVGGELGAVRRVGSDFTPIRTTISITNSQDVQEVLWAKPRGFANGPCITNDTCFSGPCVGGLAAGKCCDSACDRPCESCFQRDTGEEDGTCASVVVGKQSPKSGTQGCAPQPESSCGLTGFCDGAGECAFHEDDIQCSPASCGDAFSGAGSCDGDGACAIPAAQTCAPYIGCDTLSGCKTTCATNDDCLTGYTCESGQCVEEEEEITPTTGKVDETPEDEGCSTTSANPTGGFLIALFGFFFIARRRKSNAK